MKKSFEACLLCTILTSSSNALVQIPPCKSETNLIPEFAYFLQNEEQEERHGGIEEMIEAIDKEGIYLANWIDVKENKSIDLRGDCFLQLNMFSVEDNDIMCIIYRGNPKLCLRDLSDNKIIMEEQGREFYVNELGRIKFLLIPTSTIGRIQNSPADVRKYQFELYDDGKDSPFATRYFEIDYRKSPED